ncbi:hypothetical protein U9M48_034688 [Paspalum notatum var. saurae]|uniref:At1g61320/AtMIF1 LRR domain-containing protein n=1 Tax=Paspalum notatum var. saurae TaxID=547442 RepID=A0AAQ3U9I4_PASNO
MWQTCPALTFKLRECGVDGGLRYKHVWRFIDEVDNVLQEHRGKVIETLQVKVNYVVRGVVRVRFPDYAINDLVHFAITSRTKILALDLKPPSGWWIYGSDDRYLFPFHLFDDDTSTPCLQNLQLSFASLNPPPPPQYKGFPNLRKLHLQVSHVGSKDLQRVLSHCCNLEWLHLDRCDIHNDDELAVAAPLPRLRYLRVSYCRKLTKIEFNAVNLVTFEYGGDLMPIHLVHSMKLQGANIKCGNDVLQHMLVPLLKGIPSVQNLTLNARLGLPLLEKHYWLRDSLLLKFSNLRHLQLVMFILDKDVEHILYSSVSFLKATPFIEKLEIHFRGVYTWFDQAGPSREDLIGQCKCNNYYLKSIWITGFKALKGQLEFLLHAVENAQALEVLRVETERRCPPSLHRQYEEAEEAKQRARASLNTVLSQDVAFDVI